MQTMLRLEELSRRVFLDTNIVQYLDSFGEYFYDGYLSPWAERKIAQRGNRFSEDIEALAAWVQLSQRYGWPIAVSRGTLKEVRANRNPRKRSRLTNWARELNGYSSQFAANYDGTADEDGSYAGFPISPRTFSFLPDDGDAVLMCEAIELGCSDFLTMDNKTILRFRDRIRNAGLEVLSPVEFMERLKPWVGLLR